MDYSWMGTYLLEKKGVTTDYKEEWGAARYLLGGKMIAMQGCDNHQKPLFTMKLEPAFSELLRAQYRAVVPGYYMNKTHWSSLYLTGEVPETVVRDMLDRCYEAGLGNLSQKAKKEILEG